MIEGTILAATLTRHKANTRKYTLTQQIGEEKLNYDGLGLKSYLNQLQKYEKPHDTVWDVET